MKRLDKYGQQNPIKSSKAALSDKLSDARSTGKDGGNTDAKAWPSISIGDYYYQQFVFVGTDGDDTFKGRFANDIMIGSEGADTFNGSFGTDTVDYSDSVGGVTINLAANPDGFVPHASGGHASGDKLYSVENIIGSDYDDQLYGSSANNRLEGGGGNDAFGLDAGADTLNGGSGTDTLNVNGSGQTINFLLGTGSGGDAEGDTYTSIEHVNFGLLSQGNTFIGSNSAEVVQTWGAQTIDLNGGNDVLKILNGSLDGGRFDGGSGTDTLDLKGVNFFTSSGVVVDLENGSMSATNGSWAAEVASFEKIIGTGGTDTFIDTDGNQQFAGGDGADVFAFNHDGSGERDSILDFEAGVDQIDLSGIEGLDATLLFDNKLPFELEGIADIINGLPGSPDVPNQLETWIEQDGNDAIIHTDFQAGDYIRLVGVHVDDLSASDFIT